jgi:hypothetical protein
VIGGRRGNTMARIDEPYLNAYEEDGHYYFEDSNERVETSELVNVYELKWSDNGWTFEDGRGINSVIIE